MVNVNKESVRAEVAKLKEQFEQLSDAGKVNTEVSLLMSRMFKILELILSIFLEKKTKKIIRTLVFPHLKLVKMKPVSPVQVYVVKGYHKTSKGLATLAKPKRLQFLRLIFVIPAVRI